MYKHTIEQWRYYLTEKLFFGEVKNVEELNALCDLALRGLSQERAEPVAWEIWQPLGQKTVTYSKDEAVRCMLRADLVVRTLTYADAPPAASGTVQVSTNSLQAALNYILHCGANQQERGLPHPQQQIISALENALSAAPKEGK